MRFNLGNYIKNELDISIKDLFKKVKDKKFGFIDYNYRNFARKIREDSLSAKELIAISMVSDLKLDIISDRIRKYFIENPQEMVGSKYKKVLKIIKEFKTKNIFIWKRNEFTEVF